MTNNKEVTLPVDVNMYFEVIPPIIVPVSERAKAFFDLPAGVEGVLVLGTPDEVLGAIPDDYLFVHTEDVPKLVVTTTLSRLQ